MKTNILEIGEYIKQLRRKEGLSIRQLSVMTGISPTCLLQLEAGERDMSSTLLGQVASAIGDAHDYEEMLRCCGYLI